MKAVSMYPELFRYPETSEMKAIQQAQVIVTTFPNQVNEDEETAQDEVQIQCVDAQLDSTVTCIPNYSDIPKPQI